MVAETMQCILHILQLSRFYFFKGRNDSGTQAALEIVQSYWKQNE